MIRCGLCEGRHEIPTNKFIFPTVINPTDLDWQYDVALKSMIELGIIEDREMELYVTGLTVALITVLNICKIYDISVTLLHYDRNTNDYYEQEVY